MLRTILTEMIYISLETTYPTYIPNPISRNIFIILHKNKNKRPFFMKGLF